MVLSFGPNIGGSLLEWVKGVIQLDSKWALIGDPPKVVCDSFLDDGIGKVSRKSI